MGRKKLTLIIIWTPVILLAVLNLLTVFTPEIGFDALWYHLTLPKLWLLKKQWFFDGGLLYYSVMPRLAETIFIPLIKYTGYIGPKLLQYFSGIATGYFIWKIGVKLKLTIVLKSLAVSLFYCTWLVCWQSGSAYIDLIRTFLETVALYYLISNSWLKGGIFLGLALGTKWLALLSVFIYALVFGGYLLFPALMLATPWFIVSLVHTGNPLYPLFDPLLQNSFASPLTALSRIVMLPVNLAIPFDDFLSPMMFFVVILSIMALLMRNKTTQKIALIGLLGLIAGSCLEPPSSRYVLSYLPALIISAIVVVSKMKKKLQAPIVILSVLSSVIVLGARVVANGKYIPYLLNKQSVNEFLTNYSYRLPDTFIDSDEYVKNNLSPQNKILIDKLHNLYYFPYDFDHTSWVKSRRGYDYLITTNTKPTEVEGSLLHTNQVGIQIYQLKND